jgi:Outer membrane protein beta-barrel domain
MIRTHVHRPFPTLILALLASILFLTPLAGAQEPARVQAYGGYSLLHPKLPTFDSDPSISRTVESFLGNLSGWNGGVTFGMTKNVGITADFSGYYKNVNTTLDGSEFDANLRAYTFLFGPQFQRNGEQLRPFVRALFGVAHGSATAKVDGESAQGSKNVFAASIGGGMDVRVSSRVGIRAAQLDYYPFRSSEGGGLTFNNFRFGAGIVYYLRY